MKKTFIFSVLIFSFLVSCYAQNINYEQQLIGTWTDNYYRNTWVFNANGNLTITGNEGRNLRYGVAGSRLAIVEFGGYRGITVFDFSISSDVKILILTGERGSYLLTKN
jgi:hypothetical protein